MKWVKVETSLKKTPVIIQKPLNRVKLAKLIKRDNGMTRNHGSSKSGWLLAPPDLKLF